MEKVALKINDFKTYFKRTNFSSTLYRYTQNGVLMMLDRNKRIKERPEKIQTCPEKFDVIISLDERVYDQIVEGIC